ncbi:F-box domain containing protein [Parasponia andersonii]|uniref:F-box domain containing protein n=1 Tax=Parasponia andersonii TaxID=3476 RepID=A0A2P5BGM8_PARAD|nr:F-box domain containing protein [Parasponia andersonii]
MTISSCASVQNPKRAAVTATTSVWCDDLLEDVLVEIFSWLSPECLIGFKCVSKSWYSLISSLIKNPEFVTKHIRNNNILSSRSTTCLLFCCYAFAYESHMYPTLDSLRQKLFKSITVFYDQDERRNDRGNFVGQDLRLPRNLPSDVSLCKALRSHCNGIICLGCDDTIILCNPAIMEWRTLPKPCLVANSGFSPLRVAFGYDSRGDDYKVVRFGYTKVLGGDQKEYYNIRAEVYSMRSESWREIEFGTPIQFPIVYPFIGRQVFLRGVFYWFEWSRDILLSFNVADEVFDGMPLPNNLLAARKRHSVKLAVWNESIAFLIYKRDNGVIKAIDIWVMDDYCSDGVKCSFSNWIKKLTFTPPADVACPVAFLKNDEILMQATRSRFVLYNIRSQVHRNLTFREMPAKLIWDFSYVRSFLSVHRGSQSPPLN